MSTSTDTSKSDSKINLSGSVDASTVYSLLQDFLANPNAPNPLRIPAADPFVRHFIHHTALRMDLVSASEGGVPGAKSNSLHGQVREVVVWKNRREELENLRKIMREFVVTKDADKLALPPMAPELRYSARLIARDYGLVGISEGIGKHRHCVIWKAQDKQQIDLKLRQFATNHDLLNINKLEFPPMSPPMRRFIAAVAADLGLYAVSEGVGKDKHTVVYKERPPETTQLTSAYLRGLFTATLGTVPERVNIHDIRGALQHAEMPEILGRAAIELAEKSPDGHVSINTLCNLVDMKEKELRSIFNAFDETHTGRIAVSNLDKVLKAMDVSPSTHADKEFLQYIIDKTTKSGSTSINFKEFVNYCAFLDLQDLSVLGSENMSASSLGFQSKASTSKDASLYATIASSFSGGIANAFSRTCVAPFERVRLQLSVDGSKYKGLVDCLTSIYKNEGVKGLWRGNVLNVIRIAPQGAIAFFAKDFVKSIMPDKLRYSSTGLALGSMMSGAICMSAVYPLDFVRGRMTTCPGVYPSWQDAMRQIYRQGGVRGLFEGVNYSNIWAAVYYGVQFYSYDMMKSLYSQHMLEYGMPKLDPTTTGLVFGALSGTFCVSAAYPFESVRRKLQVQGVGGRPILYNGLVDCIKKTVQKEGIRGVYKGLGANMLKTPPSIAITFGTYEVLMKHVFNVDKK